MEKLKKALWDLAKKKKRKSFLPSVLSRDVTELSSDVNAAASGRPEDPKEYDQKVRDTFKKILNSFKKNLMAYFKDVGEAEAELKQQACNGVIGIESSKTCWEAICKANKDDADLGIDDNHDANDDASFDWSGDVNTAAKYFKKSCHFDVLMPVKGKDNENWDENNELDKAINWVHSHSSRGKWEITDDYAMWIMHMYLFESVKSFGNPKMTFKDDFDFYGPVQTFKATWPSGYYLETLIAKEIENSSPGALIIDCDNEKTIVYSCDVNTVGGVAIKQEAVLDFNLKGLVYSGQGILGGQKFYSMLDEKLGWLCRLVGECPTLDVMRNRREFVRAAAQQIGSGLDVFVLAQTGSFSSLLDITPSRFDDSGVGLGDVEMTNVDDKELLSNVDDSQGASPRGDDKGLSPAGQVAEQVPPSTLSSLLLPFSPTLLAKCLQCRDDS
jgi:hypothetical protein